MKVIDIIRKGTPEIAGYNDSVAILDNGTPLFEGVLSTEPNPYQPKTTKPWVEVYSRIAEGNYTWVLVPNHHKYGRCVLINNGGQVKTINPNPNHNKAYYATEIFIHEGNTENWRGSRGCITVQPSISNKFFRSFLDDETGKLVIRKGDI